MKSFLEQMSKYHLFGFFLFLLFICNRNGVGATSSGGIITSNFSHPCDTGDLIPPDSETISNYNESEWVAYCDGAETFGECGDECCVSLVNDACEEANLWVKKDGSCFGIEACKRANVTLVANGCITSDPYSGSSGTCFQVGFDGEAGQILDSCLGKSACNGVASTSGIVGDIISSCNGTDACKAMAQGGKVGTVENSCQEENSCLALGAYGPGAADVLDSCIGINACHYMAYVGTVDNVISSCTGESSCENLANEGICGKVESSCDGEKSCFNVGQSTEYGAGDITNSCIGDFACIALASEGSVGDISSSCISDERPCNEVGSVLGRVGNIIDSCFDEYSCKNLGGIGGVVGDVYRSCTTKESCQNLGADGIVGMIESSCCSAFNETSGLGSCESYCNYNDTQSISVACGDDLVFYDDNGMCPCEQPSSVPSLSPSSEPSAISSAMPSKSASPSASAYPTSTPSMLPSMLDRQIHASVNDLETDVGNLTSKVDGVQKSVETVVATIESNTDAIMQACNCSGIESKTDALLKSVESMPCSSSEVVELKVSVQSRSFWQQTQHVVLLVTVGGTATDADSDPVLWASPQSFSGTSTLDVVPDISVERIADGFYKIGFYQSSSVYLLKVMVGGVEKTAMFDFVGSY